MGVKAQQNGQFLRQRKMMLMMPLILAPMLTMFFWGLGGGRGDTDAGTAGKEMKGVNMSLPLAQFDTKRKPMDKAGLYDKAAHDSVRLRERMKQDPYMAGSVTDREKALGADSTSVRGLSGRSGLQMPLMTSDAEAEHALKRLGEVRKQLDNTAPAFPNRDNANRMYEQPWSMGAAHAAVAKPGSESLQSDKPVQKDPEMERIDAMLDKLIRIQHPYLVTRDTAGAMTKERVFRLEVGKEDADTDVRAGSGNGLHDDTGFMEFGDTDGDDTAGAVVDNAVPALVNTGQTVTAGATLALRLEKETILNDMLLPRGQLVYGVVSLSGDRLMMTVSSVRVKESILPVALQVYDLDGLAGIRVPGAISRDVSKESANEALSGLGVASLDANLAGQAASAGLQFARSLTSRKVRQVRVSLPAGYRVLLRNAKSITH